jgi:hypothetical protein
MRCWTRTALAVALVGATAMSGPARPAHAAADGHPDFNCDGIADLVVGAPGQTVSGQPAAGAVLVFFGTASGLDPHATVLAPGRFGAPGTAQAHAAFGRVQVAGNFDGIGCDDLAIGAPGQTVNGQAGAGAVFVFTGSATAVGGFDATKTRLITRGASGVPGTARAGARFGLALAAGDANGDFSEELAIGAPGDTVNGVAATGSVTVLTDPLAHAQYTGTEFEEGAGGVPGPANVNDAFGTSLAFGNFTLTGLSDFSQELAIGAPGASPHGVAHAGDVVVLAADQTGAHGAGSVEIDMDSPGVPGTAHAGDHFGSVLASGEMLGDDLADDLAIAAPGYDFLNVVDSGIVYVLGGSANGLAGAGAPPASGVAEARGFVPRAGRPGDLLGSALAVAHFDGAARDGSLVVGIPGVDIGTVLDVGGIGVVPSSSGTLDPAHASFVMQGQPGVPFAVQAGDKFGLFLAAGDWRDAGVDDLAVSIPAADIGSVKDAGLVDLLHSDGSRLNPAGAGASALWEGGGGVPGLPLPGEVFGFL